MPRARDRRLVEDVFGRIATNVSLLIDREIRMGELRVERMNERPIGRSSVHISFKLSFTGQEEAYGCVLAPLPDAISLACYLMMFPESEVAAHRQYTELDRALKDALLELGNFVGAAVDEGLRSHAPRVAVRSVGCQGVRENVRPAFPYREGDDLIVGRARVGVHEFPPFELIAVLPGLVAPAVTLPVEH